MTYFIANILNILYYFSICEYATVTTSQGALIIGGYAGSRPGVATVACYNNAGWSKLDDLQSTRYYHRAIINGDKVYVVGGNGNKLVLKSQVYPEDSGESFERS